MPGIREELFGMLVAVLSGMIVRLVYHCIVCLRKLIEHKRLVIEMEDLLFWIGTSIYLFVQIYHTSNGSVRLIFILGIVFGAGVSTIFLSKMKKVSKKIYDFLVGK